VLEAARSARLVRRHTSRSALSIRTSLIDADDRTFHHRICRSHPRVRRRLLRSLIGTTLLYKSMLRILLLAALIPRCRSADARPQSRATLTGARHFATDLPTTHDRHRAG